MYKIVRMYEHSERAPRRKVRAKNLTLAEAQAYCKDPETSWKTATSSRAKAHTRQHGPWFDGYEEQ